MQKGPFDHDEIIHYIQSSGIKADDLAWTEGMTEWARLDHIGDFYTVFKDPPRHYDYYEEQTFAEPEPPVEQKSDQKPPPEPKPSVAPEIKESVPEIEPPIEPEIKEPEQKPEPKPESPAAPEINKPDPKPEPPAIPEIKEYTPNQEPKAEVEHTPAPEHVSKKEPKEDGLPKPPPANGHIKAKEPVSTPAKKSSKTLMPIIAAALAVVLIGGGILAYSLLADQPQAAVEEIADEVSGAEAEAAVEQPQEQRGNTLGNIIKDGFVAGSEDWVYFSMPEDQRLIKMRSDGTEKQVLVEEDPESITGIQYINVIGDWIYYTSDSDIVKIRTDGSERTVVEPLAGAMYLNVVGDWIYYAAALGGGIYKITTDGEDKTEIHDASAFSVNVFDDWVYFANWDDDWQPYKVRTDGSDAGRILGTEVIELHYYNEALFFTTTDNLTISRVSVDGGTSLEIDEHPVTSGFIIDDGSIYHLIRLDINRNFSLLRMDPDSGETDIIQELKLFEDSEQRIIISNFNIAEDWVYIYAKLLDEDREAIDEALFRIQKDGSGLERLIDPETEVESATATGEEVSSGNGYLVDVPALIGLDFDDALSVLDQLFEDPPTVEGPKDYLGAEITIYAYVDLIENSLVAFSIGLGKVEGIEGVDDTPLYIVMGTIEGIPMDYDLEDLYRFTNIDPNATDYSLEDIEVSDNLIEFTVQPN